MKLELKYGCNPHQSFAAVESLKDSPIEILNSVPGFINLMDALNAWQLVYELKQALGLPAAASFKHVSPAGAAVAVPLPEDLVRMYEVEGKELTPVATAYVRARGADPKSSFGDFVAVSDVVDAPTAKFLKTVVSDGIIAPGYEPEALKILSAKKKGKFIVLKANTDFVPPELESRELFGMKMTQTRNNTPITLAHLENIQNGELTEEAKRDLVLGLITLKYTQSNSMGFALDGQMIGIGAGQQSRVDCTKLAGSKADVWHLSRHPKVLGLKFKKGVKKQQRINHRVRYIEGDLVPSEVEMIQADLDEPLELLTAEEKRDFIEKELSGVCMSADGFIPFRDNIDHAVKHGVKFIAQPGGSARDEEVTGACKEYGISMVHTGIRLFHH